LDVIQRMEDEGLRGLGRGPFWLGDAPSLLDFAIYPWFERMAATLGLFGLAIPEQATRLRTWQRTMQALPSARAVANPAEFYVQRYRQAVLARG
jgi:glutathione S-transferase